MKQIINVIVDNDGYLIAKPEGEGEFVKVMPRGIQRIPCIPFYQSAWFVMGNDVRPAVQDFAETANLLYGGIAKANALIACPADALPADKIMLRETFEVAGLKKIQIISKTSLGELLRYSNYIAISVSERLLIVEWYKDNVVAEAKYYNKASISKKKLFGDISSIKQRSDTKVKILIFDGCNELGGIYDLGTVIDAKKMTKLLALMTEVVFKKKTLQEIFDEEDSKEMADYSDVEETVISRDIVFDEAEDMVAENSSNGKDDVDKDALEKEALNENALGKEDLDKEDLGKEASGEEALGEKVLGKNVDGEGTGEKDLDKKANGEGTSKKDSDKKANGEGTGENSSDEDGSDKKTSDTEATAGDGSDNKKENVDKNASDNIKDNSSSDNSKNEKVGNTTAAKNGNANNSRKKKRGRR